MRLSLLAVLAAIVATVSPCHAQEPQAETYASVFVWKQASFFSDGARSDNWGGRVAVGLGAGRWGLEGRGDASGLKGQFDQGDPSTFRSIEGYLAVYRQTWASPVVPGGARIVVAPAVFGGRTIGLDLGDRVLVRYHPISAGAALRVEAMGGLGYLFIGAHDMVPGISIGGMASIPLTRAMLAVVDGVYGRGGVGFARISIAIRVQ